MKGEEEWVEEEAEPGESHVRSVVDDLQRVVCVRVCVTRSGGDDMERVAGGEKGEEMGGKQV